MQKLGLKFEEIIQQKVFRKNPMEREGAYEFLQAVKDGDFEQVQFKLIHCQYHVFDFDQTNQTPLHWAVRRNYIQIVNLLLEYGADVEHQDIAGRTPLFLAVKNENKAIIMTLLLRGASPLVENMNRQKPIQLTQNGALIQTLEKAEKLHQQMNVQPFRKQKDFWIQNAVPIFTMSGNQQAQKQVLKINYRQIVI
ncbi:Ankyrin repeat-containing domain [Pseudocohnilembus persalinus]|uniref:Ankyrin repeat-containing domain n=1 Tax=Pseudocohnilembus persalinus TaxID=266149 RepID=A0A0V0QR93_PSEPJ|nr:Ankyrin repeat-containing domain [Pseudocohnilembus persalinus]|eukprot:KRX04705.1 Ankyrin repeat-containing domain [Pseudocohnilembus persalinus]